MEMEKSEKLTNILEAMASLDNEQLKSVCLKVGLPVQEMQELVLLYKCQNDENFAKQAISHFKQCEEDNNEQ